MRYLLITAILFLGCGQKAIDSLDRAVEGWENCNKELERSVGLTKRAVEGWEACNEKLKVCYED